MNKKNLFGCSQWWTAVRKQCGSWRLVEEERGSTMSADIELVCCNQKITVGKVCFLQDIKGFTARKMHIGQCKICNKEAVILLEKRISDNKVFVNKLYGINAVKTIYRERKRVITTMPNIKTQALHGWVYGVNVQIKSKNGKIKEVRQYAHEYNGSKRKLVKSVKN